MVLLILAIGFPLQILFDTQRTYFDAATALQGLIVFYSAIHLAKLVMYGRPYLLEFFFWLYVYVWLGLAPFAQLLGNQSPMWSGFSRDVGADAAAVILLGMVAYDLGHSWMSRSKSRVADDGQPSGRSFTWPRLYLLLGFTLFTAPIIIKLLGGPGTLFVSRETTFNALTGVTSAEGLVQYNLLKAMLTIPALLSLLGLIHLKRQKLPNGPSGGIYVSLLSILIVLNILVNNPIANPRYWAGTALGSAIILWKPFRTPNHFRLAAVGILTLLVFAFPYTDYFRYESDVYREADTKVRGSTEQMVSNLDYDSHPQIQNAVQYTRDRGFTMGRQLTGAALFWVPRGIWENKPIPTGEMMAEARLWPYTNLSAPLWAEVYIDFGFLAIVPVFFLIGAFSRRLDVTYVNTLHSAHLLQVLLPVVAIYQLILMRGSLLPLAGPISFLIAFALFMSTKNAPFRRNARLVAHARS
jgi:hypothetical protein